MRFDVADLGGPDACSSKRGRDYCFLDLLARHRDAVGTAVLRHCGAKDLPRWRLRPEAPAREV